MPPNDRMSLVARAKARLQNPPLELENSHDDSSFPSTDNAHFTQGPNTSRFLSLPSEIRLLIYKYLFGDRMIHVGTSFVHDVHEHSKATTSFVHNVYDHVKATRKGRKETDPAKPDVTYNFSAFLSKNSRCCWGPLFYRVCSQSGACMTPRNREKRLTHDPRLYCCQVFTGLGLWVPHHWCTIDMSVLRTCRQVYEEAKLIPYQTNTFTFDSPPAMALFCMRSLQGPDYPWDQPCHLLEMPQSRLMQRLLSRKGSANRKMEDLAAIPISEIRSMLIHAVYQDHADYHDWNRICSQTAHLWTGLHDFRLYIDVVPENKIHSIQGWIAPNSDADMGFRAYRQSSLFRVFVVVSNMFNYIFDERNTYGRRRIGFWSQIAQREEFQNNLREYLLS